MSTGWDSKSPSLRPAIVCYADILGFKAMTEHALKSGGGNEFLQRVKVSLATAYEKVRSAQTADGMVPSMFDMKVFTDNIVVAYPLRDPVWELGEPELYALLMLFSEVQAGLAADGFFLRGAITSGEHFRDDDIVYGDALLEAVTLDKSGGSPRLVIGRSVELLMLEHLPWYGGQWAPYLPDLLEDPRDECLFVNYLQGAFDDFSKGLIAYELLDAHRENVRRGLQEHEANPGVRAKYEWLSNYHNYVCRTFASRYPLEGNEDTDPEKIAARAAAQKVLQYLVPCESLAPEQSLPLQPLDAQRLQQRLSKSESLPK